MMLRIWLSAWVRALRAELDLVDERRFTDGVVYLRYRKPV